MASRRVFLARHGNRQDFVDPAWQASAEEPYDPPLSADGVEQARRLGVRLAGEGIGSIVVSPFLRTIQTAHHVNESLNIPIFIEPGFGEFLHADSFERLPRLRELEALRADYPGLRDGYVAAGVQRYPETHVQLIERTQRTLEALLDKLPGTLLVVSHAASVCAMTLLDPAVTRVECPLCALFCLERLDHAGARWTLSLDSDVSHVGARLATHRYP
jgi:broad specificity phosphatase PhoE